ncbi:hypothetical protein [Reyranella soli]|nr:hypothetical protein [Reyranella soli]
MSWLQHFLDGIVSPEDWLRADGDELAGVATLVLAVASAALVGWVIV